MAEEQKKMPGIGEGLRAGIGVLTAFKEAVEETLNEAVDRGDMRPEGAKQAMQDAVRRAQTTFDELRDRLDVIPRREFDALRAELEELRGRVSALEDRSRRGEDPEVSGIIIEPG